MSNAPLRVLLIDDDEDDYLITNDLLEDIETQPYQLDWVATYDAGLDKIDKKQHDVYLIDYRLGSHNGLELLREAVTRGCSAPLILLTGQGDHEIDLEATQAGAADYLIKGKLTTQLLERSMRYAIEQKRTQQALRESESRYRSVSELLADYAFAYRVSANNHLIREWITDTFYDITGYVPAELEDNGRWLGHKIVHPDDREKIEHQLQHLFLGHEGVGEYRIITKEGEVRWLRLYRYPEWSDEQQRVTHLYGAAKDITEEKQAEVIRTELEDQLRQAQKMEAIGRLAGGIAHDFNNSLTVMMTCTELLLRRYLDDPPKAKQYVEEIREAGYRAASLTRQLLAFSRKQVLRPRLLDLNELVDNLDKMLRRLIGANITFKIQLSPDIERIKADPTQLEQVIMNLIINARDAMPKGGQLIIETKQIHLYGNYIHPRQTLAAGTYVVLTVSDTGSGMEQATVDRIFEPFFTTKEMGKGTGLGLATVYGIVQQSEGQIEVWSELNLGTTFKIYFPCLTAKGNDKQLMSPASVEYEQTGTVLIIEKEVTVREQVGHILRNGGFTVLEAGSSEEAIHINHIHGGTVDLLLSGIEVPLVHGSDLMTQLRILHPRLKHLYITGYTHNLLSVKGFLNEKTAVLERPFTPSQLNQKVIQLLQQ